jgi:methionyl aminopeptidase
VHILRSSREIAQMRKAGLLVWKAHQVAASLVRPGVMTGQIDAEVEKFFGHHGAIPLFKGVPGKIPFPAVTCISVNEEVVHGIPDDRPLREGDIVGLDVGVFKDGFYVDTARTIPVGTIDRETQVLLDVTRESLERGIEKARVGGRLGDISHAVETHARQAGFSVVRSLVGHGIGRRMHEEPQVPNFGPADQGYLLEEGMVLAIEPMVNVGAADVFTLEDGWTIITADRSLSAHFEDTVAITADGPKILTR